MVETSIRPRAVHTDATTSNVRVKERKTTSISMHRWKQRLWRVLET